jgi:transcriptional regulator with XRE-family HTH domain
MSSPLASNLRYLRRRANLSQGDVADHLGTDYNTISRYENGKSVPRLDALGKLAGLFQVSLEALRGQDLAAGALGPAPSVGPAAAPSPPGRPLLVTVELDGTPAGLAQVIARLRAINEVVAHTL